jgi:hypothetical protein
MARYRWDTELKKLVPAGNDRVARLPVFGEAHYDGLRATDGTPIDTKKKHRLYMQANNLTTSDDYKETWAKKAAERDAFFAAGQKDRPDTVPERIRRDIREDVARAFHQIHRP